MSVIENNNSNSNLSRIISVNRPPCYFQNSHLNGVNNEPISKFRRALPQFIAVGINNILLLVYGMTLGFPIIIIPAIQLGRLYRNNDLFLNRDEVAWLSTISLTCVPLGSILSGFYSEYIGKKRALQLVNIPIIISFLLYHFATNAKHLYLALGLSALSCGLIETPVVIYIAETIETKYRSYLTASGSIFILLGILFQYYISSILHWRMIAAISTLFPVISIILLFFIPESPFWLIYKNNLVGAIKSLKWLRGWVSENEIELEFIEIYNKIIDELDRKNSSRNTKCFSVIKYLKFLKMKSLWYPFMLISFMFFIGHFSGKTTLQTYTVQIFHTLKAPLKKFEATILLSLCDILGVVFCTVLIQFIGKRKLIFISTIGVAISFCGAGTYAYFLYKIPGYTIDNIVNNAAKVPNENIITINNITNIFNITLQNDLIELNTVNVIYKLSSEVDVNQTQFKYDILHNSNPNQIKSQQIGTGIKNINQSNYNNNEEKFIKTQIMHNEPEKKSESVRDKITIPILDQEANDMLWIPLVLLFSAAFFAHVGIKTIPWLLIGEIFPHEIRSYVAGIISGLGFFFGFLANQFFLNMLHTLSISGTFWFYSGVALYGAFLLYFILPKTDDKSLKEIENYFNNSNELYTNKIPPNC